MIPQAILASALSLGAAYLITRHREGWAVLLLIVAYSVWS